MIYKIISVNFLMVLDKLCGRFVIILDLEEVMLLPFLTPFLEALRKEKIKIIYYVGYKTNCPTIAGVDLPRSHTFFFNWSKYMLCADLFISPQIWGCAAKRVIKIHIPHGHPVKFACLPKKNFEHFDVHFVTGPLHREQTEFTISHYGIQRNILIFDIGLPKSDKLMSGYYERASVLEGLGLDPSKKTLLYAPSWESGLSLRSFGEEIFQQLTFLNNYNIIIKLHPASCSAKTHPDYDFYTGGNNWPEIVSKYEKYGRIINIITDEVDPLLMASDILITDISGVALEFLLLLKPVVYIDCPEFFNSTLNILYKNYGPTTADYIKNDPKSNAGRHVGYVLYKIDDIPIAVNFLLSHPDYKMTERLNFAKDIRYNPGHASKAAANEILQLLNHPKKNNLIPQ